MGVPKLMRRNSVMLSTCLAASRQTGSTVQGLQTGKRAAARSTSGRSCAGAHVGPSAPHIIAFAARPSPPKRARIKAAPAVAEAAEALGGAEPLAYSAAQSAGVLTALTARCGRLVKATACGAVPRRSIVAGAAPNYTVAARALGAGGLSYLAAEMVGSGAAIVRGPGDPLWAALEAGLAVDAPELVIVNIGYYDGFSDATDGGGGVKSVSSGSSQRAGID
jgi:hypothetical protein